MSEALRSEIVGLAENAQHTFFLTVDSEEGDSGHGVGTLYRVRSRRGDEAAPVSLLSAPQQLSCVWLSPDGSVWVASVEGHVATTAAIKWSAAGTGEGKGYEAGKGHKWRVTSLPRIKATGLPPNATALWGTSDDDVHLATHRGDLFHWDGASWTQLLEGDGKRGLSTIAGSAPDDVYALGQDKGLFHFDGQAWSAVPVRGGEKHETLTGAHFLADGEVLISVAGEQGRVLRGRGTKLTEFVRCKQPLIGMAALGDRVLFATGDGCAELVGKTVKTIRDTFMTTGVFAGVGRVLYLEPDQEIPAFIDYDPREETPWWRQTF